MNHTAAKEILYNILDNLESSGYISLARRVGENQTFERKDEAGTIYQIEVDILWDHNPKGAIRLIGSIDDGGLRAWLPLTTSRLVELEAGEPAHTTQPDDAEGNQQNKRSDEASTHEAK